MRPRSKSAGNRGVKNTAGGEATRHPRLSRHALACTMRARLAPQCFAANVCCLSIAYPRLSERQPVGYHLQARRQACATRVKRSETLPYRSATAHAHSIAPVSPAPIAYAERDGFPTFFSRNRQIENFSFTPPFSPISPPFSPVF